jgi:mevalonate kinase
VILFGEHAVVYGRPALAAPVAHVRATARVETGAAGKGLVIDALDLGAQITLACDGHPLAEIARLALAELGLSEPDWRVSIRSTIPIAGGMGSGAAVSAALARAMSAAAGRPFSAETVSALVYEVERLHHGTPSGVDNTVIAYGQPVYFRRGQAPQPFAIGAPFLVAIADTGIASPTKVAVGDVWQAWQAEPSRYEALFDEVAAVVEAAREAIAAGQVDRLGPLMDENHAVLNQIGVSGAELERLVEAARTAGAGGAKLSGGGRGGNMIALVTRETAGPVETALVEAGAKRVIVTEIART